jgi:tetratricopeptide (TPR) repeat protein
MISKEEEDDLLDNVSVKSEESDVEEDRLVEDPVSQPDKLTRRYGRRFAQPISLEELKLSRGKTKTFSAWKSASPSPDGVKRAMSPPSNSNTTLPRSWGTPTLSPSHRMRTEMSPPPIQRSYSEISVESNRSGAVSLPRFSPISSQAKKNHSPSKPNNSPSSSPQANSKGSPSKRVGFNEQPATGSGQVRRRGTLLNASEKHKTLRMANEFLDLGKFQEAITIYNRKLEEDPNNVVALNNKGLALDQLGEFNEALKSFEQAVTINPENSPALHNKSLALRKLGRMKEAIECYDRVLEVDPMDTEAMNNKGLILDQLGKFKKALYYYEMALNVNPTHSVALYNKGYALRMLGKFEDALQAYDEALKIDPKFADCWSNKALALFHMGRFRKALVCYDQALTLNPNLMAAEHNKRIVLKRISNSIEGKICLYCRKHFGLLRKSIMCKNCLIHFCKKDCKALNKRATSLPEEQPNINPEFCEECNRGDVDLKIAQQLQQ